METVTSACKKWLFTNFGLTGEITKFNVLGKLSQTDIDLDLAGVEFEFSCPDGTTGETVAFLDAELLRLPPFSAPGNEERGDVPARV